MTSASSSFPLRFLGRALFLPLVATAVLLPQLLRQQVDEGMFHPHGYCYLWDPRLVSVHVVSDFVIGVSYVIISLTLGYLFYRGRHQLPFSWVFPAFGVFIIACGGTHFVEILTLWQPVLWFSGNVKIVTALASVAVAIALPPLVPKAMALLNAATLAEERRQQLDEANRELEVLEALKRSEEERARLLTRERAAREEAEASNRMKDEFLATISHELRTPLNAILGWTRLLTDGNLDDQTSSRAVDTIQRNARLQARLIEELLDVSRIVTGRLKLDVKAVNVCEIVSDTIDSLRATAAAKGVKVDVDLDPQRPIIAADGERLQQVIWNLLSNALKFTPAGGHVHLTMRLVDDQLELVVTDTGIGMKAEFLPHVFQRFRQADSSSTRAFGGLGLGLAIVRHFVELHGGTVAAESAGEGLGSTFRVRIPAVRPAEPSVPADLSARGQSRPQLDGLQILVVDDDRDTRELLASALERYGARAVMVETAAEALSILETLMPDLIVSDLAMPGMDGYAFVRELRSRPAEAGGRIPAVALSAYTRQQDRVEALRAGFELHVPKPVDPLELAIVVANVALKGPGRTNTVEP